MNVYSNYIKSTKETPQTEVLMGRESDMKQNNAGGFGFITSKMEMLDRFLILGTTENSYYATSQKMTVDNAANIINLIKSGNGINIVARTLDISMSGRAPKNDPALFVLALVMTYGDAEAKRAAGAALPMIARIGTHVLHFAEYINGLRGWGRSVRKSVGNWYTSQTPHDLAMNMMKYANRDGWTHADLIRLSHPKAESNDVSQLLRMTVGKEIGPVSETLKKFLDSVENLKNAGTAREASKLISDNKLPREFVPTELLNESEVWEALLPHMGLGAMVRNIATMTRVGLIAPLSDGARLVTDKLENLETLRKSRIHPIQILSGVMTYGQGHGFRGTNTWRPVSSVVDALNEAFYNSFKFIKPTGKKLVLAVDCSASMGGGNIAGVPGIDPRTAAAVMSLVTARTENEYVIVGFTNSGGYYSYRTKSNYDDGMLALDGITPKSRIDSVVEEMKKFPWGGTDCALPMLWAKQHNIDVDAIITFTDNETYAGNIHPSQALKELRNKLGHDVKNIVVGFTATDFSIADLADASSMDVVGFDSAAPSIISDFIRGDL